MDRGRRRENTEYTTQEPRSVKDFERALREEVSVSTDFDLPLSILVARSQHKWIPENMRQIVGLLRRGDLIACPGPDEIVIALPNTKLEDAKVVERRLREAIPESAIGIAFQEPGDASHGLLCRARAAAERENLSR
jgi:hypothetical protein